MKPEKRRTELSIQPIMRGPRGCPDQSESALPPPPPQSLELSFPHCAPWR